MSEARLPIHPYAKLFPALTSPEFDALCGAIARDGLLDDIVLYEGKILDGQHRYLACLARQVPPRFQEYAGECGSAVEFVVAKNIRRRHLTESQRAFVAAKLKPLFEEDARQRQLAALKQGSKPPVPPNLGEREGNAKSRESAQQAAVMMKVSRNSVQAADKVKKQGVPQLVNALAAGKVSVSAAARIAALPVEQQQVIIIKIESGFKANQALAEVKETLANGPAGWVDDDGQPLPEGVIPAFRQRQELRSLCQRIEAFGRKVERLGKAPVGGHLDVQGVLTALEAARQVLWAAQPARVCPQPARAESRCDRCRGHGWLPTGMRET